MKIIRNVDLFDLPPLKYSFSLGYGWETSAASGQDVVIYTANYMAAYSDDSGNTFTPISPYDMCRKAAGAVGVQQDDFCCDQVVIYSSKINNFIWVLQTNQGNYVLAFATPEEIKASKGLV
jgi:hypothetical protein